MYRILLLYCPNGSEDLLHPHFSINHHLHKRSSYYVYTPQYFFIFSNYCIHNNVENYWRISVPLCTSSIPMYQVAIKTSLSQYKLLFIPDLRYVSSDIMSLIVFLQDFQYSISVKRSYAFLRSK